MQSSRVHRSDTPRYSHIEKSPHVDGGHKMGVIYRGLGPLAALLEECAVDLRQ